jgi:Tol biopolymer transport system component
MRFRRLTLRSVTLAAIVVAACHDSSTGVEGSAALHFSGAANVTDTIGAVIPQPLLVEVRDSTGALAPAGTEVEFRGVRQYSGYEVLLGTAGTTSGQLHTVTTDQEGRASMPVRLGFIAGLARVVVTVPTLALVDTARFTVNPGNAVRVRVIPGDTALYVGKSFTLHGGVSDRSGNPRPEPVTWSAVGAGITVTSAGVVTATALGRYQIVAVGPLGTDTGEVSVVPPGRFLMSTGDYSFTISAVDADGSNETPLASGTVGGNDQFGPDPAWIPGTSTVVYTSLVGNIETLYTAGADGVAKPFFPSPAPLTGHQWEPTPSADGKWVYFSAYDSRCSSFDPCVWRARIDGSAPELVVTTPSRNPAPSPDGTRVAYMANANSTIRVLELATRSTLPWSVPGTFPTWSPDGTQIAFRNYNGTVGLIAPDGTGQRLVSPEFTSGVLGWSPDGKWLLVQQDQVSALMNVATGLTLPLRYAMYGRVVTSIK